MTFLPPGERIIETKKCHISGQDFFVTDKDKEFLEKISPIFQWKKFTFPTLDISPLEMRRTLLGFRNQNNLYRRKCDISGQEIISMFSPEVPFPVYDKNIWYSDDWDPFKYGKKIDFNASFFSQWWDLNKVVPRHGCSRFRDVNSVYCNNCADVKDCYLCFNWLFNENCLYCQIWDYSKKCIDCECIFECENCYHLSLSKKCHSCWYSHELTNCSECILCYDCIGCTNCIGCYNQRNKTNCLFNIQSTPEALQEYRKKHQETLFLHSSLLKVVSQWIHKYTSMVQSEDCYGNEFQSSKHCSDCYYMMNAEDCKYCDNGKEQKDCYYIMNGMKNLSNAYCCQTVGINSSQLAFTINSTDNLSEVYYCSNVFFWVTHALGCIGLHSHEHHCIFNTAYSVQEYEQNAIKLIEHMKSTGEWWQFFPRNFSPFEYNQSLAGELFPLSQKEALSQGWNWRSENTIAHTSAQSSVFSIDQYDEKCVWYEQAQKNIDTLLQTNIICSVSQKPFKMLKQELAFYIENSIPIPTKHPNERHQEMLALRNHRTLNELLCSECGKTIITTYLPDTLGKVVCDECYKKMIY